MSKLSNFRVDSTFAYENEFNAGYSLGRQYELHHQIAPCNQDMCFRTDLKFLQRTEHHEDVDQILNSAKNQLAQYRGIMKELELSKEIRRQDYVKEISKIESAIVQCNSTMNYCIGCIHKMHGYENVGHMQNAIDIIALGKNPALFNRDMTFDKILLSAQNLKQNVIDTSAKDENSKYLFSSMYDEYQKVDNDVRQKFWLKVGAHTQYSIDIRSNICDNNETMSRLLQRYYEGETKIHEILWSIIDRQVEFINSQKSILDNIGKYYYECIDFYVKEKVSEDEIRAFTLDMVISALTDGPLGPPNNDGFYELIDQEIWKQYSAGKTSNQRLKFAEALASRFKGISKINRMTGGVIMFNFIRGTERRRIYLNGKEIWCCAWV